MTRRERLERKLELRKEWADKAAQRSDSRFDAARRIADMIPLGQPILVGHHSEAHARRDAERIHNNMAKACELDSLSKHHDSKADGIERALDNSIFSDDPDAVEAIQERIGENEEKREKMKTINALYRKGNAEGLAALGLNLESLRAKLKDAHSWEQQPYASYQLTNLGARIRADKERMKFIQIRQQRQIQAEASPNGVTFEDCSGGYIRITFAEKPDRSILDALKAAGFFWNSGSWAGKTESIPSEVAAMRS